MKNEKINATTNTTLANALVYNNRFANLKLDADTIGVEGFAEWKTICTNLQRSAYKVYAQCENNGMKVADSTVDKSEIYDCVRVILNAIGDVNGHKLYANEETAIIITGYAGRRGNLDAPELQLCNSKLANRRKELANAEKINGYNPESIQAMKDELADLEEGKATLLATADMRRKQPTMTSAGAFRLDLEHYLARVIEGQLAKTLEELDEEEKARKEARKAAAKARKAKKANEEKKANA